MLQDYGHSIQRGSWPWLVAIYSVQTTGTAYNCGGNLITSKFVISAAHCFQTELKMLQHDEVLISLGRYNMTNWIEDGAQLVEVKSIHIPVDYKKVPYSLDADIALVILKAAAVFNEYIRPICLPDKTNIGKQLGTVVGWGSDGHGTTVTDTPKSITIPIVSEVECLRSDSAYATITSNRTFCAGRKDGFGPCHGDSGSGLVIQQNHSAVLVGIVSAALSGPMNTCDLSNYIVFTNVAQFIPWIQSFL